MNLNSLNNKKIGILGLGMENQALVKYLLKHKVKCEITVCDRRDKKQLSENNQRLPARTTQSGRLRSPGSSPELKALPRNDIRWQLGKSFNQSLDKFDILFRAPGWPIDCPGVQAALKAGVELSSPMKLFFALSPSKNIIGVTGTKGKGTTASLIYEILRAAGKKVWLGGNIGVAPLAFIDKIKTNDWLVLELSSFQLEDMTISPKIAVITNLYSEHLAPADTNNPNYHKNLKEYYSAKLNIVKYQRAGDKVVLNKELSPFAKALEDKRIRNQESGKGKKVFFAKSNLPSKLIGEHNKENLGAAVEVAKIIGVKPAVIKTAAANFKGLPHRLELVRELDGVKYYDDSFATTPESTIIALKSFSTPIILFLGGADKGSNFKELAKQVKRRVYPVKSGKASAEQFHGVKFVVLLAGQATDRIKQELLAAGYENNKMKLTDNIRDAVKLARQQVDRGDIILLSTACASFGMFKNYKERGDLFKKEVFTLSNRFATRIFAKRI